MSAPQALFHANMDVVFFVYGTSFCLMGAAILLQPKHRSELELGRHMWLLALFGLLHGGNELLDMWAIVKGSSGLFDLVRWWVLVLSFVPLFEFGRRMAALELRSSADRPLRGPFGRWLTVVASGIVLLAPLAAADYWSSGRLAARYLLAFPGGLLAAYGLLLYAGRAEKAFETLGLKKYFAIAAGAFLLYALLGGMVPGKADVFPASLLNTESFLTVVGVPVQVFRAACAVVAAFSTVMILKAFHWETENRLQLALEGTESRLRGILDAAADGIIAIDERGIVRTFSASAETIFGYEAREVLGKNISMLMPSPDREQHDSHIGRYLRTGQARVLGRQLEVEGLRKDGTVFPLALRVRELRWGGERMFIGITQDITQQKRLEEIARQSEKMSAVGQLASGVAHELNNPLGVILGFAQSAARRLKEGDPLELPVKSIERESLRCKELVRNLLAFSRKRGGTEEKLVTKEVVEEALSLIGTRARVLSVAIEKELDEDGLRVLGNRQDLQQIVVNLCNNAMDAMEGGGTLRVSLRGESGPGGRSAVLRVSDTGSGMPEEVRARIFEPFFTTKEVGKGTGLGLSLVYETVRKHGGGIECESEEGKGTAFTVTLPVQEDRDG